MRTAFIIGGILIALLGLAAVRGPSGHGSREAELAYVARVINRANNDGTHLRARVEGEKLVLSKDRVVLGNATESGLTRQVRAEACDQPGLRKLIEQGIHIRFELTNVGMEPQPPVTITYCPDYKDS